MRLQFLADEVDLVLVPLVPGPRPAGRKVRARGEGHVADVNAAALLEQGQELPQKGDLLRVRQVVQGIGRDDRVVPAPLQLPGKALGEVALAQDRARHLLPRKLDHPRGKVLAEDLAGLGAELGGQRAGAKADVQDLPPGRGEHAPVDLPEDRPVPRKGVGSRLVGEAHALVIAVRPQVESIVVQHLPCSLRFTCSGPSG